MKITIFGLTISSSWGNGHATPYRAILRALHSRGIDLTFFEKDLPYYAIRRDFTSCDYCDLVLYPEWTDVRHQAVECARDSDVVIVASYCPAGARIADEILNLDRPLIVFYDLDTPITLKNLDAGPLDYLRRDQIPAFDLYLSFTGGTILSRLERNFGARLARALYGCVDPDIYRRVASHEAFACCLSYVGTYASDRQAKVTNLFLEPARQRPDLRFLLAGSMYPAPGNDWPTNICRYEHVAPQEHPALYSSSQATLNITRREMAESGYCPSGRFFEAAACATPILTDWWEGLDSFFDPSQEISVVTDSNAVLTCLSRISELQPKAQRARERTLDEHTGRHRAQELLTFCEQASCRKHHDVEVAT